MLTLVFDHILVFMWNSYLRILEFIVHYGVPLWSSLESLRPETNKNSSKKWATYWAIHFIRNILSVISFLLPKYNQPSIIVCSVAWSAWAYPFGCMTMVTMAGPTSQPSRRNSTWGKSTVCKKTCWISLSDSPLNALKLIEPPQQKSVSSLTKSRILWSANTLKGDP